MFCPQCGSHTEVSEKRGPFRDRRCKRADCALEFTTREQVVNQARQVSDKHSHNRFCARTRATQFKIYPINPVIASAGVEKSRPAPAPHPEAVAAAAVDGISRPAPAPRPEFEEPLVMQQAMLEFGSN